MRLVSGNAGEGTNRERRLSGKGGWRVSRRPFLFIIQFPVAIFELENCGDEDRIAYSLWKLLCVKAELRVVFCYRKRAADATPLKSVIVLDYDLLPKGSSRLDPVKMRGKWVRVRGVLQFHERTKNNFVPVIVLTPTDEAPLDKLIKTIPQPADPYVN